jgi:beta-lactamase class C
MNVLRWIFLTVLGLASCVSAAEDERAQALARELDHDFALLASGEDVPGMAVGIVWRGQPLLLRGYGQVAPGQAPINTKTRFRVASLSKGFAATAAAILVNDGAFAWDDPVQQFLPDFQLKDGEGSAELTVAHVLSHAAGLPPNAYDNLLEAGIAVEKILGRLAEVDLLCPVGRCHTYQNVLFSLIEPLTELTAGESFEAVVDERLFKPLGMLHAGFGQAHLTADDNWARPHVNTRRAGLVGTRITDEYYRVAPAAGINASVEDMLLWLHAQMGYRDDLLDGQLLQTLHEPRLRTRGELYRPEWRRQRLNDAHYGLGWRIYDYADHRVIYHGGAVLGYRAQVAFLPEQELGVVVMWNSNAQRPWGIAPTVFDRFLGLSERDWLELDRVERSLADAGSSDRRQGRGE